MTQFTPESRIGEIAVEQPSSTRTFYRFGIDFCCGGGKSLESVCSKKGIDVDAVLRDIATQSNGITERPNDWNTASSAAIVAHIITTYHEPLRVELPRLKGMLDKVQKVHGHIDPIHFEKLQDVFGGMISELMDHMEKEETILFPLFLQGKMTEANASTEDYEDEHTQAGEALARIRELTDDFQAPDYACNTWRALWSGFEDLEKTMHQHVHLENNILFVRAAVASN